MCLSLSQLRHAAAPGSARVTLARDFMASISFLHDLVCACVTQHSSRLGSASAKAHFIQHFDKRSIRLSANRFGLGRVFANFARSRNAQHGRSDSDGETQGAKNLWTTLSSK